MARRRKRRSAPARGARSGSGGRRRATPRLPSESRVHTTAAGPQIKRPGRKRRAAAHGPGRLGPATTLAVH